MPTTGLLNCPNSHPDEDLQLLQSTQHIACSSQSIGLLLTVRHGVRNGYCSTEKNRSSGESNRNGLLVLGPKTSGSSILRILEEGAQDHIA